MLSGSYWPGDLYLFPGLGGGKYGKGRILQDKDGKNVNAGGRWASPEEPDMDSLAASPFLVDWDGDGDLDLLVGNIAGRVVLIENEGTPKAPAFGRKRYVEAGGAAIEVSADAGPHVADWDGDGVWDLLVGAEDGAVRWYRNEGTIQAPKLGAGVILVPALEHHGGVEAGEPKRPGMRAKVCVADWNGDGRTDLLVGDFAQVQVPAAELSEAGVKELAALKARRDALEEQLEKLGEAEFSEEVERRMATLSQELGQIHERIRTMEGGAQLTGFVWVYLRRAAESGKAGSGG